MNADDATAMAQARPAPEPTPAASTATPSATSTGALWVACLPSRTDAAPSPAWLARFAPQPQRWQEGWVLSVGASVRLFGGRAGLLRQLWQAARRHGWQRLGAAPTALAALVLARSTPAHGGLRHALGPAWPAALDAYPIELLDATRTSTVQALYAAGLHTLGDLRRCPRAALAARVEADWLQRLDALWGHAPLPARPWAPEPTFDTTVDLPAPVTDASAIAFAAQRLLGQLGAWLRRQQRGVLHWRLAWSATAGLDMHHRQPMQDGALLRRLLHERLARIRLPAPVQTLRLHTQQTVPWTPPVASLLPGAAPDGALDSAALLERLCARLGAERVQYGQLQAHWDPERRQRWTSTPAARSACPPELCAVALWEPAWRLPTAQPLRQDAQGQPLLDGQPLRCVLGPQRIATGWWDHPVQWQRCIARTPDGRLWALQRDTAAGSGGWSLVGVYA
ncbi:DNA polymerase Y subunit UmuC family protein [Tepidimonas charontis]|uniref:Protein ImuB n=1 Tax=Tepidimonas charontis TaxID=2267262 RepID=A0A554XB46_9BURK|nr:hypothetical protein [Tepidimonas charontis]TSE33061.1 hypothetical protein Tchar_01869 [Tepidimonas charontis]